MLVMGMGAMAVMVVRGLALRRDVCIATIDPSRVRMMQAATKHRVGGERNQRQSLDEASNHGKKHFLETESSGSLSPIPIIGSMAVLLE